MFLNRFFLFLILPSFSLLSGLPLTRVALAASGSANQSCAVIHRYESYCRYLSPESCLQYIAGFDYWHNAEHQAAWDDFFHLCGEDPRRDPRACIAYLGIGDTCAPSVEAPPVVERYHPTQTVELVPYQRPTLEVYRQPAAICGLWERDYQAIDEYRDACGQAKPADCSAEVSADYSRLCAGKSPCECVEAMGCGRSYCESQSPTSPSAAPANPGIETPNGENPANPPTDPSSPGTSTGGLSGAGEVEIPKAPEGTASAGAPVSENGGVKGSPDSVQAVVSGGGVFMSGSGCSLQTATSVTDEFSWGIVLAVAGALLGFHAFRTRGN